MLEVRDVTRRFGGVRALDGVSFDVRPGEILGFIGPNGAGKTTLFDVISGYTPAGPGSIRLRDRDGELVDLHDAPTHVRSWRGLGRSFQDGRLFPGLTVDEAIAVALEQHVDVRDPIAATLHLPSVGDSEEKVRERVDELIELLALGAYRDKFVRELSTGTRRVVDLACVLAQGPRCCCSTSRPAASPSARPRRSPPCCGGSATSWAPACSSSSTTSRCWARSPTA